MKKTIKNITFLLLTLFSFSNSALAQEGHMTKGTNVIQAGIGFGGWTSGYTTSETPIIAVAFERGIMDNLLNGNLSVGAAITYKGGKYSGSNYTWRYNYLAVTARASWHPYFIKVEKLDTYTGLSIGYYRVSSDYDSKWYSYDYDFGGSGVALAAHVGARYNFTENFGAWAELGFGLGLLNAGVSYTF